MEENKKSKVRTIYIEDYEFDKVESKHNFTNGIHYYCRMKRYGSYPRIETMFLTEEELAYFMQVTHCSSIEELEGININTLVMIIYNTVGQSPVFIGLGYEGNFVLLNDAKKYYKDGEFTRIIKLDELDQKINVDMIKDYTENGIYHSNKR